MSLKANGASGKRGPGGDTTTSYRNMMRQKVATRYDSKHIRAGHDEAAGALWDGHLDLVLQILRHEAASAIDSYRVAHADVNSMICVVKPFNRFGVMLPYNASDSPPRRKCGEHAGTRRRLRARAMHLQKK